MGIRKLNKFLTNREIFITYQNLQEFIDKHKFERNNNSHSGKIVIAIDFWLYAHKFLHSCRSENILLGFWNQIMKLLSYGIIPLYVMDGTVPIEKLDKIDERNKKKANYKKKIDDIDDEIEKYININDLYIDMDVMSSNKFVDPESDIDSNLESLYKKREKIQKHIKRIKPSELYNIHRLFDVLEIPYVKAEFEADALCAKLYKHNIITCCLTDDMDMLVLGCGSTIKFHEGQVMEFNLEDVKSTLEFTQEQFIDMCIMFGCDYLHHPLKLECDDVYTMIKKHGSLLDALRSNEHESFNMANRNVQVIGDQYYLVKDIYLLSCDREYIPTHLLDIKMRKINYDSIVTFLKRLKWFDTSSRNLKIIENEIRNINKKIDIDEL